MTITLRPEHEQLIAKAMRTGAYQNPDEVIARALEMLQSEDEWLLERKDAINEKIERSIEQFDRGEGIPGDVAWQRLQDRKQAWIKSGSRGE